MIYLTDSGKEKLCTFIRTYHKQGAKILANKTMFSAWVEIPEDHCCIAADADGRLFSYDLPPITDAKVWMPGLLVDTCRLGTVDLGKTNWKKTLRQV